MLPNLQIPTPPPLFGLIPIEPFGILVAVAVVVGYLLGQRRARLSGLDSYTCADGMFWIIVWGFVGAHIVSMVFYYPDELIKDPIKLLYVWAGISSFGGFIGGAVGGVVFFRRRGESALEYGDAIMFGFAPAWVIGRLGCTITFDHPGTETDFVLGMADRIGVVRHNLGFYEFLLAVALMVALYALRSRRPFAGFYMALILLVYAPVRFLMDFLRVKDELYWGLTPGQYAAIAALGLGAALVVHGLKQRARPSETASPSAPYEPEQASDEPDTPEQA